MVRKMASIQRIKALEPIPNADAIERATVLGWQVVVKRGEFQVGDLCVYCEIDSQLPERAEFEFLRPRHFIVRTARLRGQISQGICFPLSILPAEVEVAEGMDVSELLGIVKYEPPVSSGLGGLAKGIFPGFIPKTDETRIQVLENLVSRHLGVCCYASEKLDGASMTCYLKDGEFGVCSRGLDLIETRESLYWHCARLHDIEAKLRSLKRNVAVQGELVGEKVQKNRLGLKGIQFFIFSLFDIDKFCYFSFADLIATAAQIGLPTVPIISDDFVLTEAHTVDALVDYSIGKSQLNPQVWREGIVFRPLVETFDEELGRLSFKAINPEYLLKHGE